jgi:hypothetical protein
MIGILCIRAWCEQISAAANSLDPLAVLRNAKLSAQIADMNIDDAIERPELPSQNRLRELLTGKERSPVGA